MVVFSALLVVFFMELPDYIPADFADHDLDGVPAVSAVMELPDEVSSSEVEADVPVTSARSSISVHDSLTVKQQTC